LQLTETTEKGAFAMKINYEVGVDDNQIFLEVLVGTQGIAYTVGNLELVSGGIVKKVESDKSRNGNIPKSSIGSAKDLRNNRLSITTTVDFGAIDPAQWPQLLKTLLIAYSLSGGFDGNTKIKPDDEDITVSQNGKIVEVVKTIKFK